MPPTKRRPRTPILALYAAILIGFAGCWGDGAAPTTIYEGGGTIPEIVDQPEPDTKPAKGQRKR